MRVLSSQTLVLRTEQLRLVMRDGSRKWQAHYKIDGVKKWFRVSTNTTDLDKAKKIAERIWMKATFDHEEGRPVISKKFKPIAEIVRHRLEDEAKAGTAKPSAKDYISAIKLYLIPFYGKFNVDCITPALVSEFHRWRRDKVGRELSGSAQNNHNAAFNLVLDEAIERGYMGERQRPATKNTGGDSDRRAEFSQEELETLIAYFPKFIDDGRTAVTRTLRTLLSVYVPFMAATGMRPGTEAEFLEWRHIDVEMRDGQPILHFRLQKGKRGARNFVAHNSCWLLLEKLRQMSPDLAHLSLQQLLKKKIDKRVFRMPSGNLPDNFNKPFRQMLEESGLLICPVTGKERSLYSLRHYYATQRLLESIPIHDLAEQMGTSVLMITKHYSHLTPLMKAKQFAGTVDGNGSDQAAQIRALMAAQMPNNIMQLIEMSTGLTLPMVVISQDVSKDFNERLKQRKPPPK
jgi:integrase